MKHHLEELKKLYTPEMQAAARISAAQPGVNNVDRPEAPKKPKGAALVERIPKRDY